MTKDEAQAIAFQALEYALENDAQYLEPETIKEWSEALQVGCAAPTKSKIENELDLQE